MNKYLIQLVAVTLLAVASMGCAGKPSKEQLVRRAVAWQMSEYPQSTLRDLYKNFFQDRFGPGHLLGDTAAAGKYLRSELASAKTFTQAYYEPTGYLGNLYRVNLKVIREGLVPYDVFFDAFVRSMRRTTMMPIDEWKVEWAGIQGVIDAMKLSLPHYDDDKAYIADLLSRDEYVVDHSDAYLQAYDPHYRIIEKYIFETELLPLIEQKKK